MLRFTQRKRWQVLACAVIGMMVFLAPGVEASTVVHDPGEAFSYDSNPSGDWTFGWRLAAEASDLTIYTSRGIYDGGVTYWYLSGIGLPSSGVNKTDAPISGWLPNVLGLAPGFHNYYPEARFSVARWTAPYAAQCAVEAAFIGLSANPTADVHVVHNGTSVFDGSLSGIGDTSAASLAFAVAENDVVDFVVGDGGTQAILPDSDWVAVDASLTTNTVPLPASAWMGLVMFGGMAGVGTMRYIKGRASRGRRQSWTGPSGRCIYTGPVV